MICEWLHPVWYTPYATLRRTIFKTYTIFFCYQLEAFFTYHWLICCPNWHLASKSRSTMTMTDTPHHPPSPNENLTTQLKYSSCKSRAFLWEFQLWPQLPFSKMIWNNCLIDYFPMIDKPFGVLASFSYLYNTYYRGSVASVCAKFVKTGNWTIIGKEIIRYWLLFFYTFM